MTIRTFEGVPRCFSWATLLEGGARDQLIAAARMPFVWPHAGGMPDMHVGLGAPIGLVYPTLGAICPSTVGVDIGCGMIAALTNLRYEDILACSRPLSELRAKVEEFIPMSMGIYNEGIFDRFTYERIDSLEQKEGERAATEITGGTDHAGGWRKQFGTMGGGNHFAEFCRDRQDRVWLFLHSGSRGVGKRLAEKHIKIAQHLCRKWWIDLPNPDLAYLVEGTEEFWTYMAHLRWCQHFAQLNREEMLHRMRLALQWWYGDDIVFDEMIRCHHNYTEQMPVQLLGQFRNRPQGRGNVWLTRKGAINAAQGVKGLLPGSMAGKSYITNGKGNNLSLWSAPHGAGRLYGRKQAERIFSVEQLEIEMQGIEWSRHIADKLVDEGPYVYKPIQQILDDSRDLFDVYEELTAFVNIKGE